MNSGAFGEGFPYTNFHELNMDWIVKIAKDFLDQYTNIQQTITEGLEGLDNKAEELETLLQEWYDTHSEDIANQLADALQDMNDWYAQHQGYLEQYLQDSIDDFNDAADLKASTTIASIPAEYTEVANNALTALNEVKALFNRHIFQIGGIFSGNGQDADRTDRARTGYYTECNKNTFFNNNGITNYYIYFYAEDMTFIQASASLTEPKHFYELVIPWNDNIKYYRVLTTNIDLTLLNDQYTGMLSYTPPEIPVNFYTTNKIKVQFHLGGLNANNGLEVYRTDRMVTDFIPVNKSSYFIVKMYDVTLYNYLYLYDANKRFIVNLDNLKNTLPSETTTLWGYLQSKGVTIPENTAYIRIISRDTEHINDTDYGVWMYNAGHLLDVLDKSVSKIPLHAEGLNNTAFNMAARLGYDVYQVNTPPQQSLPSYALAYQKGYRTMLCDVQITLDGYFVCWHDLDLGAQLGTDYIRNADGESLTEVEKQQLISELTLAQLDNYDFGLYKGETYRDTKILRLEEFLKFCKAFNVTAVLETKLHFSTEQQIAVCNMINKYGMQNQTVWAFDYAYDNADDIINVLNHAPVIVLYRRLTSNSILNNMITRFNTVRQTFPDADLNITIPDGSVSLLTDTNINLMATNKIRIYYSEVKTDAELEVLMNNERIYLFRWVASRVDIIRKMRSTYGVSLIE